MGLKGSSGKISKLEDLKWMPKWHLEEVWGKSVIFQTCSVNASANGYRLATACGGKFGNGTTWSCQGMATIVLGSLKVK